MRMGSVARLLPQYLLYRFPQAFLDVIQLRRLYRYMTKQAVSDGVAHKMPDDLKKALLGSPQALAAWESLTPLARNEWICWTISVKQDDTRKEHVGRAVEQLMEGKRRPCCWIGCIHRKDKPMSATQKWVLSKRSAKR